MFEQLQYNLCYGCGEIEPQGMIAEIMHSCPRNTINYRPGNFKIRHLQTLFSGGVDEIQALKSSLLRFPHFSEMKNFETASWIDKNSYRLARELEIRQMKRLRAYIELEEEFASKY